MGTIVEEGGSIDFKSQRNNYFAVVFCLILTSEAIHIKFHKHNCPSLSRTRKAPKNMPNSLENEFMPMRA